MSALPPLVRWRLVLGEAADHLCQLEGHGRAMDGALEWLYGRDPDAGERDERKQGGGAGAGGGERDGARGADDSPSRLSTPAWISEIQRLFPRETIERLERDAIERYQLHDLLTSPEVLARVEPSTTLLEAVLQTKHLMNPEVLAQARVLVARVVQQLVEKLAREVRRALAGTRDRRRRSPLRIARNFDFRKTLHDNLERWDPETRKLVLAKTFFFARTRRHVDRWQVILLVDQSGSMVGSVIHSAVTAACLWSLPGIKTHLVAFDTAVVDLTQDVSDPVELLMKVQLGGGTDIQKAVAYASDLVEAPRRTIVVIISDLYEGGPSHMLERRVASLCAQGTRVLALAALDEDASPAYDRAMGERLVQVGAHVAAMTPGQLASWIADKVLR